MIFITGDTHGEFDRIEEFVLANDTSTDDILIILGDAGINYNLTSADDRLKQELSQLPITLFCIHGNHEERPYNLPGYEEKLWQGGTVFYEEDYPNLLFAADGEIYDLEGKKAIAIGGAYSVDKYYRLRNHLHWFPSEQPDETTKEYVEKQLDFVSWRVDVVLSHTGPRKYLPVEHFLPGVDESSVDHSTEDWLDTIEDRLCYEQWFFGHFHCEKSVGGVHILFESIEALEDF